MTHGLIPMWLQLSTLCCVMLGRHVHLDLEEPDSFYGSFPIPQTNLHVLPEIMQLDHGQKVSALEILHALEVFLVPIPQTICKFV